MLHECSANCMRSLPLYPTINRNAVTASVLVETFQLRDVAQTVSGSPPGSWKCTSSISSRTSKTSIDTPLMSLSFDNVVHVTVHPAHILSHFDATKMILTAVAVDTFPNLTCSSRANVRHSRVKQHSG